MSEPPPDTTPAEPASPVEPAPLAGTAPPAEPPIDFEHAEFGAGRGAADAKHLACGLCQREIHTEYWQSLGKILCDSCREMVRRAASEARGGASLGKAFLVGGGAALATGIGYAVFVGLTHIQFALVTIGIGWLIGRAIQKVTRGFGSVRHQVLAVALTYFASSMGYLPAIFKAMSDHHPTTEQQASGAADTPVAPSDTPAAPAGTPAPPADTQTAPPAEHGLAGSLAILAVLLTALTLAAPVLDVMNGLNGVLGALIIFFGLRTAWRTAKGIEATFTGPHRVAAAPAGS